jgi:hypothetical protein
MAIVLCERFKLWKGAKAMGTQAPVLPDVLAEKDEFGTIVAIIDTRNDKRVAVGDKFQISLDEIIFLMGHELWREIRARRSGIIRVDAIGQVGLGMPFQLRLSDEHGYWFEHNMTGWCLTQAIQEGKAQRIR